jgi:hypothetical protein
MSPCLLQGAHSTPALADSSTHPGSLSEPRGWSPSRLSLNEPSRRSGLGRGSRPMLTLRGRSHGGGDLLTVGDNVSGTTAISGLASIVSAAQNQSPLAAVPRQLLGRGQHSLVYLGTWNAAQVVIKVRHMNAAKWNEDAWHVSCDIEMPTDTCANGCPPHAVHIG